MNNYIRDEKGKMIGFTQQQGNQKVYFDGTGKLTARIHDNRTFDGKGAFKGFGDQGMRVLGEKKS